VKEYVLMGPQMIGGGMMAGMYLWAVVALVVLAALVIGAVVAGIAVARHVNHGAPARSTDDNDALELLRRRYAGGEIDDAEYRERLTTLTR